MTNDSNSPEPATPLLTSTIRHDGWTGEKMAIFCETLAETAVVAEACDQARMGISGAYAARRRNPLFAGAWDAALTIARERLADTLLARSMEGNVEQIYKDGELVGERHVLDNRLGLVILRRLDRLAETGLSVSRRGERVPSAPAPRSQLVDWEMMVNALRTGDAEDVARALALLKTDEVEEVEGPPNSVIIPQEGLDLSDRCWKAGIHELPGAVCEHGLGIDDIWLTDFPPPMGFTGYEQGEYGDSDYQRECTDEEKAILEADAAAERLAGRAEDEALRDSWFELLKEEAEANAQAAT